MADRKTTVLLVDDDAALLRGLKRSLFGDDYDVLTAVSAAEAAVSLRRFPVDVIVCDHHMPGRSGIEFLAAVRRQHPNVVAIILSGQIGGLRVAMDAAAEIGIHRVLDKPCSGAHLAAAIESAVAGEQPPDSPGGEPISALPDAPR